MINRSPIGFVGRMNHTSNIGNMTRLNPFMVFRAGAMPHPPIGRRSVFVRTHRGTSQSHSTPICQITSFGFHYLPIHSHSSSCTTNRSALPSLTVAYLQWEHSHGVSAPQVFALFRILPATVPAIHDRRNVPSLLSPSPRRAVDAIHSLSMNFHTKI